MASSNPYIRSVSSNADLAASNDESFPFFNTFANSLSSALDESSECQSQRASKPRKNKIGKSQKARAEKVRLNSGSKPVFGPRGKTDSDSSLDTWINLPTDASREMLHNFTDSDERIQSHSNFTEWRACLEESDSLTESALDANVPRRKRKYKKMAIASLEENPPPAMSCVDVFSQKSKRSRNSKVQGRVRGKYHGIDKLPCPQMSAKMKPVCPNVSRKRKHDENKFECDPTLHPAKCTDMKLSDLSITDNYEDYATSIQSSSESTLSNTEGSREVSATEESREADDEQSDFFSEAKASYGFFDPENECDDEKEKKGNRKSPSSNALQYMNVLKGHGSLDFHPSMRHIVEKRRKVMYETMKEKIIQEGGRHMEDNLRKLLKAFQKNSKKRELDMEPEGLNDLWFACMKGDL